MAVNGHSTGVRDGLRGGVGHNPLRRNRRSVLGSRVGEFLRGLDMIVYLGVGSLVLLSSL